MGGDFCFVTPGYQNFNLCVIRVLLFYVKKPEVGENGIL